MSKLAVVAALAGLGAYFWRHTSALPGDIESFFVAAILWGIALSLLILFLLSPGSRGPWH